MRDGLPPIDVMCSWSRDFFQFWEIIDNISEPIQATQT